MKLTKEQALAQIEELKEYIKNADTKKDRIYVPNCIKFTTHPKHMLSDALIFNNDKQQLFVNLNTKQYGVDTFCDVMIIDPRKRYLVPCKREDLKTGDIAFRTDSDEDNRNDLYHYCIILYSAFYVYINGKDIGTYNSNTYDTWYKIMVEED